MLIFSALGSCSGLTNFSFNLSLPPFLCVFINSLFYFYQTKETSTWLFGLLSLYLYLCIHLSIYIYICLFVCLCLCASFSLSPNTWTFYRFSFSYPLLFSARLAQDRLPLFCPPSSTFSRLKTRWLLPAKQSTGSTLYSALLVCLYIYIFMYTHIYMYICVSVCMYVHMNVCVCVYVCVSMSAHTCHTPMYASAPLFFFCSKVNAHIPSNPTSTICVTCTFFLHLPQSPGSVAGTFVSVKGIVEAMT